MVEWSKTSGSGPDLRKGARVQIPILSNFFPIHMAKCVEWTEQLFDCRVRSILCLLSHSNSKSGPSALTSASSYYNCPMDPLQAALAQLASTLGVAIPQSTEKKVVGPVFPENSPDLVCKEILAIPSTNSALSETEEGELSDPEDALINKSKQKSHGKKRKKSSPKGGPASKSKTKIASNDEGESKATTMKLDLKNKLHPKKIMGKTTDKTESKAVDKKGWIPDSKPRVVCRYWMEGKCAKGEECTFSHAQKPNKTPEEAKSEEVCKFFMAGNCLKGDACMYSHDLSKVPCKFFHVRNECAAGSSCRFSHNPISEDLRHQLFAEMMGSRDPRLSPNATSGAETAPIIINVGQSTNDASPYSYYHYGEFSLFYPIPPEELDPLVAKLNPYGNPFVK